jgi:hypothetical protein
MLFFANDNVAAVAIVFKVDNVAAVATNRLYDSTGNLQIAIALDALDPFHGRG